jgi:hypothetical protein
MFLLSRDVELNRQFRDMCGGGEEEAVIGEEEFWESRRQQVASVRAARAGQREGLEGFWWRKAQEEQDAAYVARKASVSAAVEIAGGGGGDGSSSATASSTSKKRGGGGGAATVKLSLKASDIAKIFALYPAVQRLYAAKVPHEVSEVDFWTQFVRSEFLQLRAGGSSGGGSVSASGAGGGGGGAGLGGMELEGGLFAAVGNSDSTPLAQTPVEKNELLATVDPTVNLHDVYGDYVADPVRNRQRIRWTNGSHGDKGDNENKKQARISRDIG